MEPERLSEPLRLAVTLRYFTGASSYEAIAELCGVPVGNVRSRLSAAKAKLAEELLETAAAAHDDAVARWRNAAQIGEAYLRLERDGDVSAFDGVLVPDVAFVMYDRIERRGATGYAEELASDFEDGVRSRVAQVIPGSEVTVVEAWARQPSRPPAALPTRPHPDPLPSRRPDVADRLALRAAAGRLERRR